MGCANGATPDPTPTPDTTPTENPATGHPAVTLHDLAVFTVSRPALTVEPDHVGVVGLPTNFVTRADTQTLHGELFDTPVTVTFTPLHYGWDYGDGTRSQTDTPGKTWTQLHAEQSTPTSTSHIYRQRGTYPATVTVAYSPTVTFADGYRMAVPGYALSTSTPENVHVYTAHTVLVEHTCSQDPTGPGC